MEDIDIYFDITQEKEQSLHEFISLIRHEQAKFILGTSDESGYYILKDAYEKGIISEELYFNLQIVLIDMNAEVKLVPKSVVNKVMIEGANYTHIATPDGRTYLMREYPEFDSKLKEEDQQWDNEQKED